ncbi:MAG TPA: hypothetical protein VG268_00430 [Streptosporangiaceae bacterium]|jgi:hypothetical protein|nr:hypothetical protein [Streptosporangiaceae bacterium]
MPADESGPLPHGLLPHGLLSRLAARPWLWPGPDELAGPALVGPALLAADLAVLRDSGYLTLALPSRIDGAGLSLTEVACAQRQLAAHAPATARAVNAHHAWAGAAADALASGDVTDPGPGWILGEAARGRVFAGFGAGLDPETPHVLPPDWDWLALRSVDTREPGRPAVVYGFVGRTSGDFRPVARQPLGAPGTQGSTLIAGMHAWGLSLAGMTSYAIARRTFDLAVTRAQRAGLSLDRWPVAEASLRLDDMRGQLDEVVAGWRQRVGAGGGVTSLDPGRLGLIRQFTARHVAAGGAQRVMDLAALIAGDPVTAARA